MPVVVTPLTCHIKYIKKLNQEQNKLNHNALINCTSVSCSITDVGT